MAFLDDLRNKIRGGYHQINMRDGGRTADTNRAGMNPGYRTDQRDLVTRFQNQRLQQQIRADVVSGRITPQQARGAMLSGFQNGPTMKAADFYTQDSARNLRGQAINPALGSFARMIGSTPANLVGLGGGIVEAATPFNGAGQAMQQFARNQTQGIDEFVQASQYSGQKQGEKKMLTDLSSGAGSLAAAILLAKTGGLKVGPKTVAPTVLPATMFGVNAAGEQQRAAQDAGMSNGQSLAIGIGAGATEAALEKIGLDKFMKPGVGSFIRRQGTRALTEAGQEASQSMAQAGWSDTYKDVNYKEAAKQAGYEGLLGAMLGGGAGIALDAPTAGPTIKKGAINVADKTGIRPLYAGLTKNQVIMDPSKLDALHNAREIIAGQTQNPVKAQAVIDSLHRINKENGLDFITGTPNDRIQRISQFLEQNGEAIPELQARMSKKPLLKPLGEEGFIAGGSAKDFRWAKENGRVFDGVDGKPRFEVDDSGAKFKLSNKDLLEFDNQYLDDLGNILDHPELFKNYPQLRQTPATIRIEPKMKKGAVRGVFDGEEILVTAPDLKTAKSTLLHEIQHNIQQEEGFATGASALVGDKKAYQKYLSSAGEAEARAVQKRMNMPMSERYKLPKDDGTPSYYHGTLEQFDNFDNSKVGSNTDADNTQLGHFFIEDKKRAVQFVEDTRPTGDARQARIIQAKLDIKNPVDLTLKGILTNEKQAADIIEITMGEKVSPKEALEILDGAIDLDGEFMYELWNTPNLAKKLQAKGYDGAISEFGRDGDVVKEMIAFDAKQIKQVRPQSTFYDSLDVPKKDLIIRNGDGTAMSAMQKKPTEQQLLSKLDELRAKGDLDGADKVAGEIIHLRTERDMGKYQNQRLAREAAQPPRYMPEQASQQTLNRIVQPKSEVWRKWFHDADHKALPDIEKDILNNPELKDAGVSRLYDYYKKMTGDNISFEEFVNKDIELYRGGNTRSSNNMASYSVLERKAKRFGEVSKITVKPKDTYGMLGDFSEGEVFVPAKATKSPQKSYKKTTLNEAKKAAKSLWKDEDGSVPNPFYKGDDPMGGLPDLTPTEKLAAKNAKPPEATKSYKKQLDDFAKEVEAENRFLEKNAGKRLDDGLTIPKDFKAYRRTITGDTVDVKRLKTDSNYFKEAYESTFARGYGTDEKLYKTLTKELVPEGREASGYLADLYNQSKQVSTTAKKQLPTTPKPSKRIKQAENDYIAEKITADELEAIRNGAPKKKKVLPANLSQEESNDYLKSMTQAQKDAQKGGVDGKALAVDTKEKYVDDLSPIEDRLNKAIKDGVSLNPKDHITYQLDRSRRSEGIMNAYVRENKLEKIIQEVDNADEFDQYLIARHAKELDESIKTGRDAAKDAAIVKQLNGKYGAAAKELYKYNQKLLDTAANYGLISKDTAAMLKKKYPEYVPFNRIFNEEEMANLAGGTGKGDASLASQGVVKKIKGSERVIASPLNSIIDKTRVVIEQGERNKAAQLLASYKKLPGNPFNLKELSKNENIAGRPAISFLDKGVKRTFLTDKLIADAAKNMSRQDIGLWGRIAAIPARGLRAGATSGNVGFAGANIVKDMVGAAINSRHSVRIADPEAFGKALQAAFYHKGEAYQELMKEGVAGTSFDMYRNPLKSNVPEIRSQKNVLTRAGYIAKHPSQWYRSFENTIGRSEDFGRALQYYSNKKGYIADGKSLEDAKILAGDQARWNSTNFFRHGSVGKNINLAIPYWNAGAQGARIQIRRIQERPVQTLSKMAVAIVAPSALIALNNYGDDEKREVMENIPDYEKEYNIIIVGPNARYDKEKNEWKGVWKFPVPPQHLGIHNTVQNAIKQAKTGSGFDAKRNIGLLTENYTTFNITSPREVAGRYLPQAAKLAVEPLANTNIFTGNKIVPDSQKNMPAEDQTSDYSSGTAKTLGRLANISPRHIDNSIRTGLGGAGQNLLRGSDSLLAMLGAIKPEEVRGRGLGESITGRFYAPNAISPADKADKQFAELKKEITRSNEYKNASAYDKGRMLNRLESDLNAVAYSDQEPKPGQEKNKLTKKQQSLKDQGFTKETYTNLNAKTSGGGDRSQNLPKGMNNYDIMTLERRDSMDEDAWNKVIRSERDAEYKLKLAEYEKKKKLNSFSVAQRIEAESSLAKSQVGSKFDKDIRELYELSKTKVYNYLSTSPKGQQEAAQLVAYGDALAQAGIADNKFVNAKGQISIRPQTKGGSKKKLGSSTSKAKGKKLTLPKTLSSTSSVVKLSRKNASLGKFKSPKISKGTSAPKLAAYKKPKKARIA